MPTSWLGIVEGWSATGLGDRLLVVLVASIVHAVSLWVPCALFCIVERLGLWERWRLPRARPDLGSTTKHNVAINATAFTEQVVGTFVLCVCRPPDYDNGPLLVCVYMHTHAPPTYRQPRKSPV